MIELVIRNHWWPEVTKDVEGCDLYQRIKNRIETLARKLIMNKVLEKLWMHLIVDFITKLPLVTGKNTILVLCNKISKMVHFIATMEKIPVEGLARLFKDNI